MFAKVISRRQKSPIRRKELPVEYQRKSDKIQYFNDLFIDDKLTENFKPMRTDLYMETIFRCTKGKKGLNKGYRPPDMSK